MGVSDRVTSYDSPPSLLLEVDKNRYSCTVVSEVLSSDRRGPLSCPQNVLIDFSVTMVVRV